MQDTSRPRILVIKHGALGDLVQALDAFAALRRHHADAELTLLTAPAFAGFGRLMPYFDQVWEDTRPRRDLAGWLALRRRLRRGRLARVYDLQCSQRTATYFRLLGPGPRPEWIGAARGCSHPLPPMHGLHNRDRMAAQIRSAGVGPVVPADLGWLDGDAARFGLPVRFVLMAPGCSPHLPHKRWPAAGYAALARTLAGQGVGVALVGTAADRPQIDAVRAEWRAATDLGGRTSLGDLAALGRRAVGAVGNDTGPMHLFDAVGCPATMLLSRHTDPAASGPRGPASGWLKRDDLADLPVAGVLAAVQDRLR